MSSSASTTWSLPPSSTGCPRRRPSPSIWPSAAPSWPQPRGARRAVTGRRRWRWWRRWAGASRGEAGRGRRRITRRRARRRRRQRRRSARRTPRRPRRERRAPSPRAAATTALAQGAGLETAGLAGRGWADRELACSMPPSPVALPAWQSQRRGRWSHHGLLTHENAPSTWRLTDCVQPVGQRVEPACCRLPGLDTGPTGSSDAVVVSLVGPASLRTPGGRTDDGP
mmetsp:Transcript_9214/g.26797  ORF Transcript_9214/g.26797 Transcript_9214/m.26797 type:complete len:226 (-) Transcript_9214:36-713(-)